MTEIINFATAAELIQMIEAGNAAVSGMTAAEAAAALGAVETSQMVAYNVIQTAGGEIIQLTGATASEAFAAYEAAGGAISASGAASESAGAVANLTEIITAPGTAAEAVATGGILTMSLPTWFAAAAPLLGVGVGVGLYELSPSFWEKVSRALLPFAWEGTEAMPAVVDANGQVYLSKNALDALKALFEEEGVGPGDIGTATNPDTGFEVEFYTGIFTGSEPSGYSTVISFSNGTMCVKAGPDIIYAFALSPITETQIETKPWGAVVTYTYNLNRLDTTLNGTPFYYGSINRGNVPLQYLSPSLSIAENNVRKIATALFDGDISQGGSYPDGASAWEGDAVQDYTENSIEIVTKPGIETETYCPAQLPIDVPSPGVSNDPVENPDPTAPTPLPEINPYISPLILPGQYPEELPVPDQTGRLAPLEDPIPLPEPTFDPSTDPSQQPENDPEPAPEPPPSPSSGGITPPYILPTQIPSIVPTGDVSGLIHVYNPTPSEMISFGRWLWVTYADATIDKIWNNPFDGILGAFELYATPSSGAKENIRSGFLISDTQAAVVPNRYISINCGSIVIPEVYANYLDYSPYSKAYAYLPFIGIVELDVDDIVGHGVNITYHVDTYNGSCIAQITVAKSGYSNTVYQFSGNCGVDIPLSGGSQAAIKAGLIGAAATGIASVIGGVASGLAGNVAGGVGGVAYGLGGAISHAVSQKSTVQHSGTFGASYGAMGIKIPYIIIRRPIQKSVVNYNDTYGFPAHKRVVIGSCSGYLRVREVDVISTSATDDEKKMIEDLLKEGVYVN